MKSSFFSLWHLTQGACFSRVPVLIDPEKLLFYGGVYIQDPDEDV